MTGSSLIARQLYLLKVRHCSLYVTFSVADKVVVSTETKLVHAIFQNDFTELHLYDNLLGLVGTWFLVN